MRDIEIIQHCYLEKGFCLEKGVCLEKGFCLIIPMLLTQEKYPENVDIKNEYIIY